VNRADIPGLAEGAAALRAADYADGSRGAEDLAVLVLTAATAPILAAAFADLADAMTDDTGWPDGQVLAVYLDTVSARIRERAVQ
jgi:hypothetical protein